MQQCRAYLQTVWLGVLAGIMIGIGGIVYLAAPDKVTGAVLFAIGLLTICSYGLKLYTGAVGYLLTQGGAWVPRLGSLGCIWLGNLLGTGFAGGVVWCIRPELAEKAAALTGAKLSLGYPAAFLLALFCGMLMYIAVDLYRNKTGLHRLLGIFVAVPVFILAGFEHSIANMFYFAAGQGFALFSGRAAAMLLVVSFGNAMGALLCTTFPQPKFD